MFVGFAGLGGMGSAMASRLIGAGHRVRAWNRSPEKVQALVKQGAEAAGPAVDLAEAEVIVSMLAEDAAVREVFLRDGLLAKLRRDTIHVNMATVSVELARELAALHREQGATYIAAPVLGRPDAAEAGRLNILVAGPSEAIGVIQPLFDVLGQKTWRFGERPEQANAVKIAANLTLACAIEAMGEAAQLVNSYEVAPRDFLEMLTGSLFACPAYKTYSSMIAEERFSPAGFKARLGLKDVRLALSAGEAAHVPLPFGSVLRDNFLDSLAHGEADMDWSVIARVAKRRAGAVR
jgi:3-hydroxyisobutyrate dehydrogenase-like beta-hydroxyacid dehydrogenase